MNIFLMLLAFMFMGGYYYFFSPSMFVKSETKEEVVELAPIKTLISCMNKNHQDALNDNEVNSRPNKFSFIPTNLCSAKYNVTSVKVCLLDNKITDECYPNITSSSVPSHYIITKSSFLQSSKAGRLIEIIQNKYSNKINLGYVSLNNDKLSIIASGKTPIEIPNEILEFANVKAGDIINFSEITPRNYSSDNRPVCISNNETLVFDSVNKKWTCKAKTMIDICLGNTEFDSTTNKCIPNRPDCNAGYVAELKNGSWECVAPKTKKTCKAGKVLFYNHNSPYADKYECIDDPTKKEAPGSCQTVSPDGEITDLEYSPRDYGCTPCETINNTFCNNETDLKPFCMPDSSQITNPQCMDSLELENCVNEDEKNPTKSIVFNFPDTKYIQNILNSDDYSISRMAPDENLSNFTKTKPYFKFSCLDCSPLVVDTSASKYPYYATCKKIGAGTQETLCNDKNTTEFVWAIKSSENKSGIVCQTVNEFDDSTYNSIFDGCPYGYVRGGSNVNYACRPNWCDYASNGSEKVSSSSMKCPDSDKNGGSIMVVLDKTGYYSSSYFETLAEYKNNVCIYCWKPSFAVPELKSVNTSKTKISTTPLRYAYYSIFNTVLSSTPTQNPKTTTSSSTNGIIPLIAAITSKYINFDNFGKLDMDSFKNTEVFDENGIYQGLDNVEFKASKSKLYIPIPQNILQKLYNYGGEVFLPCPTLNQYGQCNNYSTHLFSRPGQIREWVAITDSVKTNYWWEKLLGEKNTEDEDSDFVNRWWNNISVGEVDDYAKFYGNFTPTGDLNISYAVSYPLPWGAGITKTKIKIGNSVREISFENPYNEDNTLSNTLFPYYGCETSPEGFEDNCDSPCFDIVVNESSKLHEFTKAERLAIFNPAKYFFKSTSSSLTSYNITTSGDYQMLSASGSANQIYLRTEQCPVISSETTAGCPPYMIRYWDNNAWSACVYNICNNSKANNLDWANNLANGKKQGFIYYKDSDNNCVGIAQPSTVNGDDNNDKFIARSGTAYQRLVEYNSNYRKYSNLVWYQTADVCPYGSYYYWNDDYGWIGCVYNFMKDSEITNLNSGIALNNDSLWGFYSPSLAGTKKITKLNQSVGSIWDPTAESFETYAERRGLNTSKNSNRIVMLSQNISGTTTKQNIPALYLWTPPAWVAIEDKKSESNTTSNFFINAINTVVNEGSNSTEYSVVSPLETDEETSLTNANVGTFNKTGTTLKTFISSMPDFTTGENKIEYLQNTSNNNSARSLTASDLSGVQNHFMTPEYITNTARKINDIKTAHYDSALFGPNRLFYKDIEYFLSDEIQNQTSTTGKLIDYTLTSISDYGCFAGFYVKYENDSWSTVCENIEYCNESDADNSDKSGYIALIRNSQNNSGKICIEFAIPDPEIYEENLESEIINDNGNSTYNCTQILGNQNTTISTALSSISSYDNSDISDSNCLNKAIINCVNYECPETCETAKCRQCCKTSTYQTIPVDLYNGIPGVYRFLLTENVNIGTDESGNPITEKQTSWSNPFVNWCDSDYNSQQYSGYVASYFYNDTNPFVGDNWKTANNLKTKQINVNNLFNNLDSSESPVLTLPCLYLWKPNTTNTSVFSACANESSDWNKIKCIIKSAIGIDYDSGTAPLLSPNYTCTSDNCFSLNDVYGVKLPDNFNANSFVPSNSSDTYSKTDTSGFVHRFNDLANISWNASSDPVFCADIINLSKDSNSIHQEFCSGRGDDCNPNIISDISVSISGISPFTEGIRRLNNDNSCKLDNPKDIPNNCWNFGNLLHDDGINGNLFTYFAHDLTNDCISLGWRKNQISSYGNIDPKYKNALINQHFPTFNSAIIDKLPVCGTDVDCSVENSTLYNCENADIFNITPEHWNKYWKCLILKSQTVKLSGNTDLNEFIITPEQIRLLKHYNQNIVNASNETIYLCNTDNFAEKLSWENWRNNIKACEEFINSFNSIWSE